MRIAIVSNTSWYLFNFRLNLMRVLAAAGHTVVAVAPLDGYSAKLRAAERTGASAHTAAALPAWPVLADVMRGG